ncbi:GGDEF domain-containing protein [Mangrovimicrobium sediminis]|uniref:diguanylate cyclase n=1 Tax=Mangrovimicrobium sediminis TaxID=2562682 RepID=A0A4Z0M3F4_9GAMM|nr:GGDEF domain-containing protein [Haliea sp. SAOS-164]TGD73977.1 GGDEF domain-containing protein [Haliea sp. SAOS-164]
MKLTYTGTSNALDKHPELKRQFHLDFAMRARSGMGMYLAVWLISALWGGVHQSSPVFFYGNTAIFVALSLLRLSNYLKTLKSDDAAESDRLHRVLVALLLVGALHWGVTSAWISSSGYFPELHYLYMIVLAAFAIGGTAVLSISRPVGIAYPLLIFLPSLLVMFASDSEENVLLAALALFSVVYVLEASRITRNDYWESVKNHNIAEERAQQLEQLSITDRLTGLSNRMHFDERFEEEWKRCQRSQLALSILMIDLDHFKQINDTYGHVAGDECLRKVAAVLKTEVRRVTDVVARYGGEEFVAMLPDTSYDSAARVAQSLVQRIGQTSPTWHGQKIPLSCSIGVACVVPEMNMDKQALLMAADSGLYEAKKSGRNRYILANLAQAGGASAGLQPGSGLSLH